MRALAWCVAAALASWLGAAGPLAAQNAPAAGGTGKNESVQELKPDVLYLRDENGKLEPVLGFSLEDFERLLATGSTRGGAQPRPSYRLERVAVEGSAKGERAELSIRFTVFVDDKDWVRVPLRLGSTVLRGDVKYTGPGEQFLDFDDATDEYVAWIRGASDKPHVLALDLIAPLTSIAGETRLRLNVPRAWNSELSFDVPAAKAVAQVSSGAVLDATTSANGRTKFKVLGLGSDFSLSWRQAEGRAADIPLVLEATGGLLARVDGRSINTQAQLTVRSFGAEFDSFRVRLPPGASLLTVDQPDYTLHAVDPPKSGDARRIVEVRLRGRSAGPVHVRLVTEQTYDVAKQQQWLELGGFEVLGAVRQWGHLAVQVVGDWQLTWGQRRLVRQVEDLPAELWRDNMLAGFEYFAQPFSLLAQVTPRQSRIHVDPAYLVLVGARRVELDARLKFNIAGAKAFELQAALPGWQVDEVGPVNRVAVEQLAQQNAEPLTIPLRDAAAGDVEITIRAHRDLPAEAKTVEFTLPKPVGSGVGVAEVVVLADDNVDLAPQDGKCVGLVRQFSRPTMKLPSRQQPPWVYHGESAALEFAANLHVYQRRISVALASRIQVETSSVQVEQRFTYTIARESVSALVLEVPRAVADEGKLDVTLHGQTLSWQPLAETVASSTDSVLVKAAVPAETIGVCELVVRYPLAGVKPGPRAAAMLRVPLVVPGEGTLTANELTITSAAELHVQPLDGFWRPAGSGDSASKENALRLASDTQPRELLLQVRPVQAVAGSATVVDRAWIQSWLTPAARQDRAVYRLSGHAARFHLKLPPGARMSAATVGGAQVEPQPGAAAGEFFIPLEAMSGSGASHTVEVDYSFADRTARWMQSALELRAPELDEEVWPARVYWQVVLPRDEVLVGAPAEYTEECTWHWESLGWGREPVLSQSQLEDWSGARHDVQPAPQLRQYLFSTMGGQRVMQATTVRLSQLVLGASGTLLVIGLLLIYIPRLRHPAVALAAACCLAAAVLLMPDFALILGEAATIGVVLVFLAMWLERAVAHRRSSGRLARSRSNSAVLERGSTQTHYRPPPTSSSPPSTATAPVAQLAAPEAEP